MEGLLLCAQVVSRLARVEGRVCVGRRLALLTAATATTHMLLRPTHSRVIMGRRHHRS